MNLMKANLSSCCCFLRLCSPASAAQPASSWRHDDDEVLLRRERPLLLIRKPPGTAANPSVPPGLPSGSVSGGGTKVSAVSAVLDTAGNTNSKTFKIERGQKLIQNGKAIRSEPPSTIRCIAQYSISKTSPLSHPRPNPSRMRALCQN